MPQNKWISAGLGAADDLTFGFADEISGASAAIPAWLQNKDALKAYETQRDRFRAATAEAQEDNPGSFMAGGLATGILTPAIGMAAKGASAFQKAVTAARTGAAMGGVRGVGNAESVSEIPKSSAQSAAMGAAFGLGMSGLGSGASKGSQIYRTRNGDPNFMKWLDLVEQTQSRDTRTVPRVLFHETDDLSAGRIKDGPIATTEHQANSSNHFRTGRETPLKPLNFFSSDPKDFDYVRLNVARRLLKDPQDVTWADIRNHGALYIVDRTGDLATLNQPFYRIPADMTRDSYWKGKDGGAWSASRTDHIHKTQGENAGVWVHDPQKEFKASKEAIRHIEPNDIVSQTPTHPTASLTGNELAQFLKASGAYGYRNLREGERTSIDSIMQTQLLPNRMRVDYDFPQKASARKPVEWYRAYDLLDKGLAYGASKQEIHNSLKTSGFNDAIIEDLLKGLSDDY